MQIVTSFSIKSDSKEAITEAYKNLIDGLVDKPDIIFLNLTVSYNAKIILSTLNQLCPNIPIHGGTSCYATMTQNGIHSQNGFGLSLFGIFDPKGAYGVGACELDLNPKEASKEAANKALLQINKSGEMPAMVWIIGAPGTEEDVIIGLTELFGSKIPIGGGSSADDTIQGNWCQIANKNIYKNAVTVAVLFPTAQLGFSFHSGYEATTLKAIVTKAEGRNILELNGEKAAELYNKWTDGNITEEIKNGGSILGKTTLFPIGRLVDKNAKYPYYQLSHPASVIENGGISLFSKIEEGEEICLMRGSKSSLINRVTRVVHSAINSTEIRDPKVKGALVVYCAGCMLSIKDELEKIVVNIKKELGENIPFLGEFTFGEQGCFLGGEARHGNLMISILVFLE